MLAVCYILNWRIPMFAHLVVGAGPMTDRGRYFALNVVWVRVRWRGVVDAELQ
jgi:hypothetical protein